MKFEQYTEEWKRLYNEEGLSFREIAKTYNTTSRTVNRTLQGHVEVRPKSIYDSYGEEWLRLHKEEGYTKQEIADKYKTTYTVVNRVLKKMGVFSETRKLKYGHLVEKWKKQYQEGLSLREIGEQSGGVSSESVRQYLEREGFELRSLSEAIRHYDINEHYFDEIDNKEKAYHLGLVFAVGSVIDNFNSYLLNISVQENNLEIAQKIAEGLGVTTVYVRDKGEISFRYSSHHLYQTLCGYGLLPNKDKDSTFPDIEKDYVSAFTLGYWEGRGSFPRSRKGYIQFNGSPLFLGELQCHLETVVSKESLIMRYQEDKDSYMLRISRKEAYLMILDWLYTNNSFFTEGRVPPFYENEVMGIKSDFMIEVYGKETRMVDFVSLKPKRIAFELKLIDIQPVITEHFQRESIYEKIYIFQNPNNKRLFKWYTRRKFDVSEGEVYTFRADIEKEEDVVIWFYRVLFDKFPHDKVVYVQ